MHPRFTRAALPPIDGIAQAAIWDNRGPSEAKAIPARLLILGGGVAGVEMAQAMRRLGSTRVTIVEIAERLLPREEPFVGDEIAAALEADGVIVHLNAQARRIHRDGTDGPVTLMLADGRQLTADELLVAAGRYAPTDDLGLHTIGVEPGRRGFIEVDDHLRVPWHDWLYVVGDANGRALVTHQGKYQARLVGDALGGVPVDPAWADRRAVRRVAFTDRQVAAVGPTAAAARNTGHDGVTVRHDVGHTAGGALHGRGTHGTVQLVVDRHQRTILGATFVGPEAGELLHAATVAVVSQITVDQLWHALPAFPTMSEVWLRLLERLRADELRT